MKLTCAIIDDEPLAVELLESYVRKTPFLELKGAYNGGITALEALKTIRISERCKLFRALSLTR